MPPAVPAATLAIYAVLLIVGGIMGYLKAGSKPSLIAGISCGLLAGIALAVVQAGDTKIGYGLGLAVAFLLVGFFARRFAKGRKFMPTGMLAVASLIVVVILAAAFVRETTG
jgi:uncharacterized membrane protein (UPF0136 family)